MAYEMVMPYHLHMPSYFLETFTEYPFLRLSSSMNSFRMNKFLMFFNIVKIYQSTQAVLNLAVFQFSFSYTKMKKGSRDG